MKNLVFYSLSLICTMSTLAVEGQQCEIENLQKGLTFDDGSIFFSFEVRCGNQLSGEDYQLSLAPEKNWDTPTGNIDITVWRDDAKIAVDATYYPKSQTMIFGMEHCDGSGYMDMETAITRVLECFMKKYY